MNVANAKEKGAYYTPTEVAATLVRWAVRHPTDRLLDPACGDGQFLLLHSSVTGVEQDVHAVAHAARRTKSRICPCPHTTVDLDAWKRFSFRLRPFILPPQVLELYCELAINSGTFRAGDVARIGIGYVTGDNSFFHLRPSEARSLGIPDEYLFPAVRNSRALPNQAVTRATVARWIRRDDACLLMRLAPEREIPDSIRRYLNSERGRAARHAYKCRNRDPWYVVPDIHIPDAFLAYMSGNEPALVANKAGCVCTNSVHAVRIRNGCPVATLQAKWRHPLTVFSQEIEGHSLGGGMLKLEPREASKILLPRSRFKISSDDVRLLESGTQTLRQWRHYD